jgi:hypothetical protein
MEVEQRVNGRMAAAVVFALLGLVIAARITTTCG